MFRLLNAGADTLWVSMFEVESADLQLKVVRSDGVSLPQGGGIADYIVPNTWRGVPVPGGTALYETQVLQDRFGPRPIRRGIFLHDIPTGSYQLEARFNLVSRGAAHWLDAEAIPFVVRPRDADEDTLHRDVAAIMSLAAERGPAPRYVRALLAWVDATTSTTPSNVYLAYLLNQGIQIAWVKGGPSASGKVRLAELREQVAAAQRDLPAGAVVVDAILTNNPDRLLPVSQRLGPSLAGKVAAYRRTRGVRL